MPAYTAETALERVARHARERGGYTMRLDSLRAPGSAANDDPNTRRCIDPALADSVMNANLAPQRFAGERLQG